MTRYTVFTAIVLTLGCYPLLAQQTDQYRIRKHSIEYIESSRHTLSTASNGFTSEFTRTAEKEKYDSQGRKIASWTYDTAGSVDSALFFYDGNQLTARHLFRSISPDGYQRDQYTYDAQNRLISVKTSTVPTNHDSAVLTGSTNHVYHGDSLVYHIQHWGPRCDTSITRYKDSLDYRIQFDFTSDHVLRTKTICRNELLIRTHSYGYMNTGLTVVTKRNRHGKIRKQLRYASDGTYLGHEKCTYRWGLMKTYESTTGNVYRVKLTFRKFDK